MHRKKQNGTIILHFLSRLKTPRIAIVCDWLTVRAGAESVIESFLRIWPEAEVFTTVFVPGAFPREILSERKIHTTWLQHLPIFLKKKHPFLLPFLPRAIETLDLTGFDIIVSSSSFVGKGVITQPNQLHICYCHTPTRYLWGDWQEYITHFPLPGVLKKCLPPLLTKLRQWDRIAAERPDVMIANSDYIADSIAKYYRRSTEMIAPPVDCGRFRKSKDKKSDTYLYLGRLAPQKRVDTLIAAFKKMPDKHLVIAGSGRMEAELREQAKGAENIEFRGFVPDGELVSLMSGAKALLHPQLEDAGITALEALAAGTPVIAFGRGGVLTTMNPEVTEFFAEQSGGSVCAAVERFEQRSFDKEKLQKHAQQFDRSIFEKKIHDLVMQQWQEKEGD